MNINTKIFWNYLVLTILIILSLGYSNTLLGQNKANSKHSVSSSDTLVLDSLFAEARLLSYNNSDEAIILINKLITIAKTDNYQRRLGNYYGLMGRMLLNNSDLEESIEYLLMAAKVSQGINNVDLDLEVNNNLAFFYIKNLEFDQAKIYLSYLMKNLNKTNDKLLKIRITNTLGNYYSDLNYYSNTQNSFIDSALTYFNISSQISIELQDADLMAANYISLGICYYDKKDYKASKNYYLLALQQSERINDSIGIANTKSNIGSVYFDQEDYKEAIKYYKEAKSIYIQMKYINGDFLTDFLLADAHASMEDYRNAYLYYVDGTLKYDSIFDLEKEEIINDLLVEYETQKKESEINRQNEQIKLVEAKSKSRKLVIISLIIIIAFIIVITLFLIKVSRDKNKLMLKEVEIKNQEINKLLKEQELKSYASMLEGQDKERQRVASDLHDRLGGILSTVKAYFQTIDDKISSLEDKTVSQYNKASELLSEAVDEVRNISHDLHSGVLKNFGLLVAINDLKDTIELTGKLNVELYISGDRKEMSASTEIDIYRLIQELFSNTMKHAEADKVTIQISFMDNSINIIFEDDGVGFDMSNVKKGIGLKNIEARATKMSGDVNIDSRLGRGTIVIIDIPIL